MIKSLTSGTPYIMVSGGSTPPTYINHHHGALGVGDVRFNTAGQYLEVYDGSQWHQIYQNHANVSLSSEAVELLDWAKNKRIEERNLQNLMDQHPGLKDLHEKFEIMLELVRKEETEDAN